MQRRGREGAYGGIGIRNLKTMGNEGKDTIRKFSLSTRKGGTQRPQQDSVELREEGGEIKVGFREVGTKKKLCDSGIKKKVKGSSILARVSERQEETVQGKARRVRESSNGEGEVANLCSKATLEIVNVIRIKAVKKVYNKRKTGT